MVQAVSAVGVASCSVGEFWSGSGFAQDVEAEVVPRLGPFVVLFGQHGADEADQRSAVGEDFDDVGASADLFVKSLLGIVRPDLAPDLLGKRGERQQIRAGVLW